MPGVSTPKFLAAVEASGLLSADKLAECRAALERAGGSEADPHPVAQQLVRQQWITRWQAQQLLAGRHQFFLGQYKLLEKIGAGGMGAVFKAEHAQVGRLAAIKVMSQEGLETPQAVARFRREIETLSAVDHPNIIRAIDADTAGETHFLVMEFAEGKDLKQWLDEYGRLPIDWATECISQAAQGLQHAHTRGLVHRDIKPGNLLVIADDTGAVPRVKILDLGLACFANRDDRTDGDLTQTGQIMGSVDYMSPEQARNTKLADIRSDIFSLGCTLFRLLAGEQPFSGESVMEKLMARTQPAPLLRTLRPDVPPTLEAVVAKMLATNPNDRYQTPIEVADALAVFAMSTKGQSEPSSSLRVPGKNSTVMSLEQSAPDPRLQEFLGHLATQPDLSVSNLEDTPPPKGSTISAVVSSQGSNAIASGETAPASPLRPATLAACALAILMWAVLPEKNLERAADKKERSLPEPAAQPKETPPIVQAKTRPAAGFALEFDGTSHVTVPWKYAGEHPLTIDMWLTSRQISGAQHIFADLEIAGIGITAYEGSAGAMIRDESGYCTAAADGLLTAGQRVHLAAVFDGSEVRLYVDGRKQRKTAKYGVFRPSEVPTLIGANPGLVGDVSAGFLGTVDEVRISRGARYTGDFTPSPRFEPDAHTEALYHFDEGEGNVARDASVNARNGKIVGARWVASDAPAGSGPATSGGTSAAPTLALAPFNVRAAREHQSRWAAHLGRQVEESNSIAMKLVLIPAGEYEMGSLADDPGSQAQERPRHRVRLTKPFYLGVHEVTQGEFTAVVGRNPSAFQGDKGGPRNPVEQVSWDDAVEFCKKLSEQSAEIAAGRSYRLPTEAEWEFACRAGGTTAFSCGPTLSAVDANFDRSELKAPVNVGKYPANGFGLRDMHGNVFEWCADVFEEGAYARHAFENPFRPGTGSEARVIRGGNFGYREDLCRSASRDRFAPNTKRGGIGFRVAVSLEAN